MEPRGADPEDGVGMCRSCRHLRVVTARANSRYYRCDRSTFDRRYPKYPRLPVRVCDGHDRAPAPPPGRTPPSRPASR